MTRKSFNLATVGILSLALFGGEAIAAKTEATKTYKDTAPCCSSYVPKGLYIGVFGGGGGANDTHASQRGTAFFSEISSIGPLAVDSQNNVSSNSTSFGGLHLGYAWSQPCWLVSPGLEFEWTYLRSTLHGTLNAPHTALPEHTFKDNFPFATNVFLINGLLAFKTGITQLQAYLGGGIGGGVLSVSNASSFQVSPPEPGVNHFGAKKSASDSVFAGQVKVGLNYAFNENWSVFAEYRFLYLGPTWFNFGSTIAPGHAPTSPWGVSIDGLHYNLGAVGIQFTA